MIAGELKIFDKFLIEEGKYSDGNPWIVCTGATLDLFLVSRDGVHIVIYPNTKVKFIQDDKATE